VIGEVDTILQSFLSNSAISNLQALNAYYDATSMSAYASACLVKLSLLQQKVFLGAPDGSISEINALARSCGQWMQVGARGEERGRGWRGCACHARLWARVCAYVHTRAR
jgi:hypothetical protein